MKTIKEISEQYGLANGYVRGILRRNPEIKTGKNEKGVMTIDESDFAKYRENHGRK